MQITTLGGAAEVGASCALLEVAGARILIDAGIRTSSAGRLRPLPDFSLLAGRVPDTVIVTHPHTDHTGALPLLSDDLIGEALIHMTTGTLQVLEVLQLDAVGHQEDRDKDTEGKVSYTVQDVERMVSRVVPHSYGEWFHPVPGRLDIQALFVPCGHVLGAAMLVIDSPEGRDLWTGDYSVTPQPTVGGVDLEQLRHLAEERPFRAMVTEGTYGANIHPSRDEEESRLLHQLEKATRGKGLILIPAFAVGRSQDIGILIRRAKLEGKLNDVAVYFDGMVREITSIYQAVAHEIYPGIAEPLEILDPEIQMYRANAQSRARLLSGEMTGPAIVISSSGMLIGGKSVEYAAAFAPKTKNALLITGYTDEESPGRAVQNLKPGGRLILGKQGKVRVRCKVGRYGLSAHADFAQVRQVIEAVRPQRLAVLHGDPSSLKDLANALKETRGKSRTVILENGRPWKVAASRGVWTPREIEPSVIAGIVRTAEEKRLRDLASESRRMPLEKEIRAVWECLVEEFGERLFSEHEMCRLFLGNRYKPEEREELSKTLADHRLYFLSGSATGQRSYRPRSKDSVVEMLVERSNGFQIPVHHGDVVLFSDGSTDIHAAIAQEPRNGDEVEAVVIPPPRRAFRREWVRSVPGIDASRYLTGRRGTCVRWLEDLLRESRSLEINAAELYVLALEQPDRQLSVEIALASIFPRGHDRPEAARMGIALSMASADRFFRVQPGGAFEARPEDEVAERWDAYRAYLHIRSLPPGTEVQLTNGQSVVPTGERSMRSFEAMTSDGLRVRCNYRRVMTDNASGRTPPDAR